MNNNSNNNTHSESTIMTKTSLSTNGNIDTRINNNVNIITHSESTKITKTSSLSLMMSFPVTSNSLMILPSLLNMGG